MNNFNKNVASPRAYNATAGVGNPYSRGVSDGTVNSNSARGGTGFYS